MKELVGGLRGYEDGDKNRWRSLRCQKPGKVTWGSLFLGLSLLKTIIKGSYALSGW